MLNILSIYVNNNHKKRLTQGELHLLEHCIAKKTEYWINENSLENEGIIMNAETFIDSLFVEIMYSNRYLYQKLEGMFLNLKFSSKDLKTINNELKILESESLLEELTEEEEYLYHSLKEISGSSINDLIDTDIRISQDLIDKFNDCIKNASTISYYENKYTIHTNDILVPDGKHKKNISIENKNYLTGYIMNPIKKTEEYILNDFYSFVLGKSNQSYIHKNILEPNNLYLGYTHNVIINNNYIILFLIMTNGKSIETKARKVMTNIFKGMSEKEFKMYKNAYITFFLMQNTDPKFFMQSLGKFIQGNVSIIIDDIHKIIQSLDLVDCQSIFKDQGVINVKE